MKLTALVDFDGVILTSPGPSNYVKRKVEQYVKVKSGIQNGAAISALNEDLYKRHGHTFLGLKRLGLTKSLREFNDFVYGQKQEYAHYKLSENDQNEWQQFKQDMANMNISVKLFSNSDKRWLTQFLDYDKDLYSLHDALETFEDPMYSMLLKPERELHDFVHYQIPRSNFVFLDDKLSNFEMCMNDPRWLNIWIDNRAGTLCDKVSVANTLGNSLPLIKEKSKNLKMSLHV